MNMGKSLRKIRRQGPSQQAVQAVRQLSSSVKSLESIKDLGTGIETLVQLAPVIEETSKLVEALIEDYETLATENEVQRETFLRLLITLSNDSEENIRKVENDLREALLKERAGT